MRVRSKARALCLVVAAACLGAQTVRAQLPGQLPGVEPLHDSGQDVTPAFEGWYKNPDGSFNILLGYNNRNLKQELDIPVGPNNKVEPGQPDQGQPTHFYPRRGWGVFTVTVPKDFANKKVTWTLTINGRTNSIPVGLDSRWEIDAMKEASVDNTPPTISFVKEGPKGQGPRPLTTSLTATTSAPLTLNVWATDDGKFKGRNPPPGPPVKLTWSKYRGPGTVTFAKPKPDIDKATNLATTTASFSEPGEYWLRVVANDSSGDGGGGFQCCWTNGIVKVTVTGQRATSSASNAVPQNAPAAPAQNAAAATTPAARGPVVFRSASEWAKVLADKAKATPTAELVSANIKSGDKYMINVVRRTKPQGAIAHAAGTEIHSLIDGSGTLVTDGTIVRPAGDARGGGTIQNGKSRKVVPGDVVLVPPNTPHWYQSIDGVVTYLEIRFDVGAPAGAPAIFLPQAESKTILAGKAAATPAPLLFDAPLGRGDKYQANVVKRTKAQGGGAHELGSEIHQILDGSGTFVTGGKVVRNGQTSTIEGGDSRHVQKGDIVLIPAGTPHWYKDVEGSITYLEVRFELPTP